MCAFPSYSSLWAPFHSSSAPVLGIRRCGFLFSADRRYSSVFRGPVPSHPLRAVLQKGAPAQGRYSGFRRQNLLYRTTGNSDTVGFACETHYIEVRPRPFTTEFEVMRARAFLPQNNGPAPKLGICERRPQFCRRGPQPKVDTVGFGSKTHCIGVAGSPGNSDTWVLLPKPTVSKLGHALFANLRVPLQNRTFWAGVREAPAHSSVGRAPGPKSLFLAIRCCGRLFLANLRYSSVFVVVSAFSQLVGAIPRYSLLWIAMLANRRYSPVFVAVGAYS
jgi:hypothetical protein